MKTFLPISLMTLVMATVIVPGQGKPTRPQEPALIARPDAFKTLVNPECSHCRDEARRRATELREDDRALAWTRGYSDGGAIPYRFFLNPYRVISDSYGVFVYDPDAGFARGFAPSYDFSFYGWRNGVMVMKHKDGTLYSCLTGVAFDGPKKGERLKPLPTLVTDWGFWLNRYPGGVAYKMFEKYQPVALSNTANADSRKSRGRIDKRLPEETLVLGVTEGKSARAYPQQVLARSGLLREEVEGQPRVILWYGPTRTAAAYRPLASPPKEGAEKPRMVTLEVDTRAPSAPFIDKETGSRWDIAGRAVEGGLKGWTLTWLEGVQVKWFAWAAEYPETSIFGQDSAESDYKPLTNKGPDVAGPLGNLDGTSRRFGILKAVDPQRHRATLLVEGEAKPKEWSLRADAELWCAGWWGRLDQFTVGDRVWIWFQTDGAKQPATVALLADELSQQDLYAPVQVKAVHVTPPNRGTVTLEADAANKPTVRTVEMGEAEVYRGNARARPESLQVGDRVYVQTTADGAPLILDAAAFEKRRNEQRALLRKRWADDGLPGTIVFSHPDRGEVELMLDHEAIRWGRWLKVGDKVTLRAAKPIPAVVEQLRSWRERTQLLLRVDASDQSRLTVGQRVPLRIAAPPTEAGDEALPAGLSVASRGKQERVEWLAASVYCPCKMHDECAGHLFTLAACNSGPNNPCSTAKRLREEIADLIDKGRTDRQIIEDLVKKHGPKLLSPHMLP
jgi:hypothetical protein